jgi:hypothetical protein
VSNKATQISRKKSKKRYKSKKDRKNKGNQEFKTKKETETRNTLFLPTCQTRLRHFS